MNKNNDLHWLPIEERKNSTTFDGSLQSKMTNNKILKDLLKADLNKHYIKRRALVILKNQLIELLKNSL